VTTGLVAILEAATGPVVGVAGTTGPIAEAEATAGLIQELEEPQGWSDSRVCHNAQSTHRTCCRNWSCRRDYHRSWRIRCIVIRSRGIHFPMRMLNSVEQGLTGRGQPPARGSDLCLSRDRQGDSKTFPNILLVFQDSAVVQR